MADLQHDALAQIEAGDFKPVEIDLDAGKAKEPGASAKKPAAAAPPPDDENTAALRRQLADEKRGREAAEARNREIEAQRRRAEEQSAEGQVRLITTSLETANADKTRAAAEIAAHAQAGEWAKFSEAQVALNDAQIRIDRLSAGRLQMERQAEAEKAQRERQPEAIADPVEAMISAGRLTGKSASWLRANPDCVTDPRKNRQMVRAHEDALDEAIAPDTAEYFAFIEKKLGIGHDDDGGRQEPERRQAAPPPRRDTAAPPSRSTNGDGRGSRQNTITLSPAERQFCKEAGIDEIAYARNKVAAKDQGMLN